MPYALSEEHELLRQLAKGNEAAFAECYERYRGPIYRFAWHMTGAQSTAEEVTQEVFLRLIAKPKGFDASKGTLAGYLFGIARNVMRQHLAATGMQVPLDDELAEDDAALSTDVDLLGELDRRERVELLQKLVVGLPEGYREALVLCDLQEMTYPEAAAVLNCAPGTVASRLHRARGMLKTKIKATGCMR